MAKFVLLNQPVELDRIIAEPIRTRKLMLTTQLSSIRCKYTIREQHYSEIKIGRLANLNYFLGNQNATGFSRDQLNLGGNTQNLVSSEQWPGKKASR